jgi:NAD(P)-dependent dehydrogenase (short-subunit alcohol dehydrogenase family)
MAGKTVLVTGSTGGIGKVTALELARMGANVCIVARNKAKGEAVLEEIKKATGNAQIELFVGDLSGINDVRRVAQEFKAKHPKLHVLVNNAGGVFDTRQTTTDGLEYTFAFNHLAYFLLTNLLLETLKASAPSRVVNVSSAAQANGKIDFDDLMNEKRYSAFGAYSASKLANVMFTYALARRLKATGVTVNALHPGVVGTNFGSNAKSALWRGVASLAKAFSMPPERGAETSVYLASSSEVEGVSGKYFDKKKAVASSAASQDEAAQERLWAESAKLVGLAG